MIRKNTLQIAENFAHESYRKDVLYREWNTKIDGLYGKISEYLPPNPYLKTDKKIITTTEGEKFTLINPAYMTRMVHDLGKKNLNIVGHITSLDPIRPENRADEWEQKVLQEFEQGKKEATTISHQKEGKSFRFMAPLYINNSCLKRHSYEQEDLGKVRGGISVTFPLNIFKAHTNKQLLHLFISFFFIWLSGTAMILYSKTKIRQMVHRRLQLITKIIDNEKKYHSFFDNMLSNCILLERRNKTFIVKAINSQALNTENLKLEEIINHSIHDLFNKRKNKDLFYSIEMVWSTGDELFLPEIEFTDKNKTYWRSYQIYRQQDENVVLVYQDTTEQHEREKELQLMKSAIEQSMSLILITDSDGHIFYTNPMFQKTTEYTIEELSGQNAKIFQSGEHSAEFYENLWKTILSGETWHGEFHNRTKSGKLYWENAIITPIFDKKGTITHFIKIGKDVTEEKKFLMALEKNEKRFRTIVETSHDAMVIFDHQKITFFNKAFLEMVESEAENIKNQSITDFFPNQLPDTGPTAPKRVESLLHTASGKKIDVEITATELELDNIPSVLFILRDITAHNNLLKTLRSTIENTKGLNGLIPICASCKNIRDDEKEDKPWMTPEAYIHERLPNVDFTHSICPDCIKKHYPEFYAIKFGKEHRHSEE